MPISNDWNIDYSNKIIQHIDGVLYYQGNTSVAPSGLDYIRGETSGAVGKVITGSDLGGTVASGELTLTNVVGVFQAGESLAVLSEVPFDTVGSGGFTVGNSLEGLTTERIYAQAIEYNLGTTAGEGTIFGNHFTSGFANGETIVVSGTPTGVAVVNGPEIDNSSRLTGATATGTLQVPNGTDQNSSAIIHYDTGSIAIPEDARIADASTGAWGFAQRVSGSTTTGSVRLVDNNTLVGDWTDDNGLNIEQVVFYDNQVVGQVFSEGDIVVGSTSGATGRILAIIDDGDSTGKIILADQSGTWDAATPDDIEVSDVKIAEVENTTTVLAAATLNIPSGVRVSQRASQGGIYSTSDSLNIVRSANALYTYIQDTFDELAQMDDEVPMSAQVKDQQYTLINSWKIPDLSFRFLEKGSFKTSDNANIWTNYQSIGTIADIGDHGFFYDSSNPTPQPNIYVEQNGSVLRQDWLEGNIDIILKVKTNTRPDIIDGTVPALGQLINTGRVTVFTREYLRTYSNFQTTTIGGVAPIPLATADDLNNNTGQYRADYDAGSAATLLVGEEFTATTGGVLKVGIVTAQSGDAGATGQVSYALKSATQFADNDACTGAISGKTFTINEPSAIENLVAGYNTNIKVMTVDRVLTGGTTSGTFIIGEGVTQAVSGATGFILEDDGGSLYIQDNNGTAFDTTNEVSGDTSLATNTPSGNSASSTVPKNLGDGSGDENYTAVISGNITGASAQTILRVYEWTKFLNRSESLLLQGGPGAAAGVQGRIYRRLQTTYAEVPSAPYGTFAGGKMFGAQGVFIDKDTLAAADLQNIQLINNAGTTRNPPNLQTLEVINLEVGVRATVYRTTAPLSTTILRSEFKVGTVGGGNNESGDSAVLVAANTRSATPLPSDVPDTGTLRILDPNDTGNYLRFPYSSVNRATNIFTLGATIGSVTGGVSLTADDNVHVVLVSATSVGTSVSNTVQYVDDIPLLVDARLKGKLPFRTTSTFSSTGASVGAVLQDDTIVNLP